MVGINQTIKCVVIGDESVGKSCLAYSYANDVYPGDCLPTVYDINTTNVSVDGENITIELHDALGSGNFMHRFRMYPDTDIVLICFSLLDPISYENVRNIWYPEINEICPDIPIILVGNKLDLTELDKEKSDFKDSVEGNVNETDLTDQNSGLNVDAVEVSISKGLDLAIELNAAKYIECSSKTLTGLRTVFDDVFRTVIKSMKTESTESSCVLS